MRFKILLIGLALSFQVQAASEQLEKYKALAVVKNYANAVACGTSFQRNEDGKIETSVKDVYTIEYGNDDYSNVEFYVLWSGDHGCAGGTGTRYAELTKVVKSHIGNSYVVIDQYPFGEDVDKHINYRFITEFKQLSPNLFKVVSGKFADDDVNSAPSLEETIIVERKQMGSWKVISSNVSKIDY